jgi:alkanesulfonate monooxygenase SsuD/methylene tetrahydromethanopterin reductase-like flavin-dependent oxidoreductase (luciferase family)
MRTSEEYARAIKFGLIICGSPPSESVRQGILAEKYGFDSVWVPDHLVDMDGCRVDPWTVLAGIGVRTQKVFLCPGVTDILRCHPAKTAQIVASLDELTGGRAGLGIGAGEAMNIIPFGMAWEEASVRIHRLKEAVEVIKLLWSSSKGNLVNYAGEYYHLDAACLDQAPTRKSHPPIYIGALGSSRMLRLVGELGDGWFSWIITPELFEKRLKVVHEGAINAGRKVGEINAVVWLYVAISEDRKVIRRAMNVGKALLATERSVLRSLGHNAPLPKFSAQHALASRDSMSNIVEAARDVPDEAVYKTVALGSVDNCIEMIDSFIRRKAAHIAIRDLGPDVEKDLKIFANKVIPYFKDGGRGVQ